MKTTRKLLNPFLAEFCEMDLLKKRKKRINYTFVQKWISTNIFLSSSSSGYNLLRKLLPLPDQSTIKRLLRTYKLPAGLHRHNIVTMKTKLQLQENKDRLCWILMDEMAVKEALSYDQVSDRIYGYEDTGTKRTNLMAKQAFCVMVKGVLKSWKYPVAYYLSRKGLCASEIKNITKSVIKLLEQEGFTVLGITTDQCGNFQRAFKELGCTASNPKINVQQSYYYVFNDAPHLLKSARNMLHDQKKPLYFPSFEDPAKWKDVEQLFHLDGTQSLKLAPKLSRRHVENLRFGSKMKVNLAAQVLSRTVSKSIDLLIVDGEMSSSSAATSAYCLLFNNIFDVFNGSHSSCKVPLRRPVFIGSKGMKYLESVIPTLIELDELNRLRKVKFIKGWIQNINALKGLILDLKVYGIKYLSLRNLCQDPLELMFSKVRQICKNPDSKSFADIYARLATASLIRAPASANCETFDQCLSATELLPSQFTPPAEEVSSLNIEDVDAVLNYEGSSTIGKVGTDFVYTNCVSYFAGVVANKVNDLHIKHRKQSLTQCKICCNILGPRNQDSHLFVSYKEYYANGNPD